MTYYLGLDCGGTKTAALILNADGRECGRGAGGPGNLATNTDDVLRNSVQTALQAALKAAGLADSEARFAGVCAGAAGSSLEERRAAFVRLLRAIVPLTAEHATVPNACRVEPDYLTAYWGATHGEPGIVVIAGTGAVVFGRNARGATHREDGLGYLLGDRGSGFNLGLRMLRYTLTRMQEGTPDALSQAVQEQTGAATQSEMMLWLYGQFSPSRVASLAPLAGRLADAGDEAARAQVAEMAQRLRHSVRQTRHKLWLEWDAPVYCMGGLWEIGQFFRDEFAHPQWHADHRSENAPPSREPRFILAEPKNDAAHGAALLARRVESA